MAMYGVDSIMGVKQLHLHFLDELWKVESVICHQGKTRERAKEEKNKAVAFVRQHKCSLFRDKPGKPGRVLFEWHYSLFTAFVQSHYR